MSNYTVWDIEANNLVGDFTTEEEALQTVRELLDAFGDEFAEELQLGGRDDADRVLPFLSGSALVRRVRSSRHPALSPIG